MNRTFTRIAATLTGPAIAAGILAAALAAPAQATAGTDGQSQNCTTSTVVGAVKAGAPTILTRAGQIASSAPNAPSAPSTCVGH